MDIGNGVGRPSRTSASIIRSQSDREDIFSLAPALLDTPVHSAAITLTGTADADTLADGGIYDMLQGLGGNDTYIVGREGVTVVEARYGGTDKLLSAVSVELPGYVENLVLTGTAAIDGGGSQAANYMYGNEAANTLYGYGRDDVLSGNGGDDRLYGGYENDRLYGGTGDDLLDGGHDVDHMEGGDGNDIYYVDNVRDTITEWYHGGAGGFDKLFTSVSFTLPAQVEEIAAIGTAATTLTGNEQSNMLVGNTSSAANTLVGGGGNDNYFVGAGDRIVEAADGGIDTLIANVGTFTLSANVENLRFVNVGRGYGNALDNDMRGGTGDDQLDGMAGNDTLQGGTGNDLLIGGAGDDALFGGAGNDSLSGGAGGDRMEGGAGDDSYVVDGAGDRVIERAGEGIDSVTAAISYTLDDTLENLSLSSSLALTGTGNALANVITGNDAANVLTGGGGNDTLRGNAGADTFVLSAPAINGLDQIVDFVQGTDRIGLHAADYGLPNAPLTPDYFQVVDHTIGPNATFVFNPDDHTLYWDTDGAGGTAAIALMHFQNDVDVLPSDFVLL